MKLIVCNPLATHFRHYRRIDLPAKSGRTSKSNIVHQDDQDIGCIFRKVADTLPAFMLTIQNTLPIGAGRRRLREGQTCSGGGLIGGRGGFVLLATNSQENREQNRQKISHHVPIEGLLSKLRRQMEERLSGGDWKFRVQSQYNWKEMKENAKIHCQYSVNID